MKTAIVEDCLQQDVSILNTPKRLIFLNNVAKFLHALALSTLVSHLYQ